jgi:hypothetical protein
MPRAKRPLAEADANALRVAPNPKFTKTDAGKTKKRAAGGILEGREGEETVAQSRNSTRKSASYISTRSARPKTSDASLHENQTQTPPKSKFPFNHHSKNRLRRPEDLYDGHIEAVDLVHGDHEDHGSNTGSPPADQDPTSQSTNALATDYKTKDNSKMRTLLFDWCMSTSGSREELIARLEKSSFDYEIYSSEQLTEIMKRRQLTNTGCPKAIKIRRLILNDSLDRDTGNYEDMMYYVQTDVSRICLEQLVRKQEAILVGGDQSYSNWSLGKLSALLKERKLSCSGNKDAMIARLRSNDQRKLAKDITEARKKHLSWKQQLETQVGHPVDDTEVKRKENNVNSVDRQMQTQAQTSRPKIPICDFNWRESHWASRTERDLREICRRRDMPGLGPKAAMIKWLETGSVEYEDLYGFSLEMMCMERKIKYKRDGKKVELIRSLKEADEQEEMS